jgi:hypothetical protein
VHYKPTDAHAYLHFPSSHPPSTKCSIPFSQLLRLRRICSSEADFASQARNMLSFFRNRGYPDEVCRRALERATNTPRSQALRPTSPSSQSEDRPILVLTYHPHNLPVKHILFQHFHLLQEDPTLDGVFPLPPLVAYKRDTNLRDMLVSSRVRSSHTSPPPSGTSPCGHKRCVCCPHILNSTSFTGPSGQVSVRSHFDCLSSNLVYVVSCSLCGQLYVGETYRTLKERASEHLRAVRLPHVPSPVGTHFRLPNHSIEHFHVSGLWQNHGPGPRRVFMESRMISALGSHQPQGMNQRN